jgi:hypothetical protein
MAAGAGLRRERDVPPRFTRVDLENDYQQPPRDPAPLPSMTALHMGATCAGRGRRNKAAIALRILPIGTTHRYTERAIRGQWGARDYLTEGARGENGDNRAGGRDHA